MVVCGFRNITAHSDMMFNSKEVAEIDICTAYAVPSRTQNLLAAAAIFYCSGHYPLKVTHSWILELSYRSGKWEVFLIIRTLFSGTIGPAKLFVQWRDSCSPSFPSQSAPPWGCALTASSCYLFFDSWTCMDLQFAGVINYDAYMKPMA